MWRRIRRALARWLMPKTEKIIEPGRRPYIKAMRRNAKELYCFFSGCRLMCHGCGCVFELTRESSLRELPIDNEDIIEINCPDCGKKAQYSFEEMEEQFYAEDQVFDKHIVGEYRPKEKEKNRPAQYKLEVEHRVAMRSVREYGPFSAETDEEAIRQAHEVISKQEGSFSWRLWKRITECTETKEPKIILPKIEPGDETFLEEEAETAPDVDSGSDPLKMADELEEEEEDPNDPEKDA